MVLEEAASSSDSFTDRPFSSDNDPYATQSTDSFGPDGQPRDPITLDLTKMSKPIPIVGSLVGYPMARVAREVAKHVQYASNLVQRPLTMDEATAVAEHAAAIESWASYGAATGAAIALRQCYKTRSTYKFPFWTPPVQGWPPASVGPFRGNMMRAGLHLLRIPPYWFLGTFIGGFVMDLYAKIVSARLASIDKRLVEVKAAIVRRRQERQDAMQNGTQRHPGQETAMQRRPGQQVPQVATQDTDDMSPTSGAWQDSPSDTSVFSDSQMRAREIRQSPGPYRSQTESRDHAFPREDATRQSDAFDDASPTGGMGPMDSSVSGGSAWDRIRQQAASGQSPAAGRTASGGFSRPVQKEQQQGSSLGDSFTFSRTDEEKQLAKAQAQREFDAQVDRERNGGDREDSGKRW
ncbi:uncharacterized protein K452DRAFT_283939 [Aplosporella prunicola CBS 121167]|uniref:Uncharacterized protein n=1 Tax=Aplosporella prunicola CBS 121167 TaxID=1176127 RepID=A0A6A6BPF2_9PEZI|nr:uncharacterized protein K452DRAFT_283939 [Aplosporella prunicola CBS 121167]KAF2145588.1 hypothetical protein K452DRAFT_283939 [Aplosporella prunicola CBS 121167]